MKTLINYQQECGSRLPCGLCLITNNVCPFLVQTFEPYCTASNEVTTRTNITLDASCPQIERKQV